MAARNKRRGSKSSTHGSKSAFVREHANVGAQDLVKLARKQGMTLTAGHVYNIRAMDKRRGEKVQSPGARAVPRRTKGATANGTMSADEQLRSLLIRVGLDRAEQILAELKTSVF